MNGKENIINKILADADDKCQGIIASAQKQADAIVDAANSQAESDRQSLAERIDAQAAERVRNRKANAELDAKKYKLNARQQVIAQCYELAYKQLASMTDKDRASFIGKLLSRYAETGETVFVTKADAKLVTQAFLDGFNKKLVLGRTHIDADGGIVLEGDGYEKDLTLQHVVGYLREQTEGKVAACILGEQDE